MNTADAAEALAMCAAYDNRTPTRIAAEAWAAALPDIRVEDVKTAIVDHYGQSREWIMPADIATAVRVIRARRLADASTPQPPETIDPDDVPKMLAWTRARNAAIGDGHDESTADRIACATVNVTRPTLEAAPRPVPQLVQQVSDALPRIPRKSA